MRYLFLLLLYFFAKTTFSQVNFEEISFNTALQKAKSENKLIFLQVESDDCSQCNDVARKGLSENSLTERINQLFICLKIDTTHTDWKKIQSAYNMNKGFGTLFIDYTGTLIHSFRRTTTNHNEYKNQIDVALNKAAESVKIIDLDKEYRNGKREIDFLESYLLKRKTLNLTTDSLLNEYMAVLPPDSLQSPRIIVFIAQMFPMLDSRADREIRKNRLLFDKAWYSMNLSTRVNINNGIISKGMQKAFDTRNERLAIRTASFARGTHTNPESGAKAYEMNMLRFYENTGDTSKYFIKAIAYYDRYFMGVNPDSIKLKDSLERHRLFLQQKKDTIIKDGKAQLKASIIYSPTTQNYTRELNNGAWSFYKMTNTPFLLSIATEWVKKGLAFFETPEALDTYARLLYKQAQKEKAIEIESKAITLRKEKGISSKEFEVVLEKMEKNSASLE